MNVWLSVVWGEKEEVWERVRERTEECQFWRSLEMESGMHWRDSDTDRSIYMVKGSETDMVQQKTANRSAPPTWEIWGERRLLHAETVEGQEGIIGMG